MEDFLSFPSKNRRRLRSSSSKRRRRRSFSSSSSRRDQKSPSWAFDVVVSRMRSPSSEAPTEEGQKMKRKRKAILTMNNAFCLVVDLRARVM